MTPRRGLRGLLTSGRRRVALIRSHPTELLDRIFNKIEFSREPPSVMLTHEEVLARAYERYGYRASDNWLHELHDLLGHDSRCDAESAFLAERQALAEDAGTGHGLDSDDALARVHFCLASHLEAERIVETGVARGVSSRFFLRALENAGRGHLWSVDLPPLADELDDQSGSLVPNELRHRWTFLRGSSRRVLPGLVRELGEIDIFVHDSQHTERNMQFELELGWAHVRPGGVIVADDIHENAAFRHFLDRTGAKHVIGQELVKAGLFGIALKQ